MLAVPPPAEFVERLKARGVERISVGRVIVATWEPHQTTVLDVVREMGLDLHVSFNKGAVMILPSGVNKATGLDAALRDLKLSAHNVVGVGDAENDHAFLASVECAVAVSNALDVLKEHADWTTTRDHGAGVVELIDRLDAHDLAELEPQLTRHHILLGTTEDDQEVRRAPYGRSVMVAGTSGSGKSTLTTGLLERLAEAKYQFAIIDPEGDYTELEFAVAVGDPTNTPTIDEVETLLRKPEEVQNAVVNLVGFAQDRPGFSDALLPRLQDLRAHTGRPHWIVIDEVHHLLPATWDPADLILSRELNGMLYITVHPKSVTPTILHTIDVLLAVGEEPEETILGFCKATGRDRPRA